jgi:hypothetical protein
LSRQSENVLFSATQKCPLFSWFKSSLNNSYDEARDYMMSFSRDDCYEGNKGIFFLSGKEENL